MRITHEDLEMLPEKVKMLFMLLVVKELSMAEVAQEMGISSAQAYRLRKSGRTLLTEMLTKRETE